jgi:hypothetical protein
MTKKQLAKPKQKKTKIWLIKKIEFQLKKNKIGLKNQAKDKKIKFYFIKKKSNCVFLMCIEKYYLT